jgi:hypothetical protein
MSRLGDLEALRSLVDLKYRQQQESFSRLIAQENKLRASLAQLDAHMRESQCSTDAPQKAIGADVIWQTWVGRKKHEVNIQLAQILALKERHVAQVRHAYGKVLVINDLHNQLSKEVAQKKAQSQLDRAISSTIFRRNQ